MLYNLTRGHLIRPISAILLGESFLALGKYSNVQLLVKRNTIEQDLTVLVHKMWQPYSLAYTQKAVAD